MALQEAFSQNTQLCLDGRITGKSMHPLGAGGHADVYQGFLDDRKVAIKVVRPFEKTSRRLRHEKLLRRLWREYRIWTRLCHPNVLTCLGYSYDFSPESYILPSLVSPWMENRTVTSFLRDRPDADRMKLLVGITAGLVYLHTRNPIIIHGDLRGGNILVSDEGTPCLTDFGLSRILEEEVNGLTTSSDLAGSMRWMAPELFHNDGKVSLHSDVWALGMTALEILSGERPYSTTKSDLIVFGQIKDGHIPVRPSDGETSELIDDRMWNICRLCWAFDPIARPSTEEVASMIGRTYASYISTTEEGAMISAEKESDITLVHSIPHNRTIHSYPTRILNHNGGKVRCFSFSADGKYLAVASDCIVEIYDTSAGFNTCTLNSYALGQLSCVCFSFDGEFIATGDMEGKIWVWRIANKRGQRMFNQHRSQISALEFSSDGRFLLSAGYGLDRKVRVWNMETYRDTVQPIETNFVSFIWSRMTAFSPTGYLFAIAHNSHIYILDAQRNIVIEKLAGRPRAAMVTSVAFTTDGKGLVSGTYTGDVKLWDLTPLLRPSQEGAVPLRGGGNLTCVDEITYPGEVIVRVAVQRNGFVLSTSQTGHVRVWDTCTAKSRLLTHLMPSTICSVDARICISATVSVDLDFANGILATVGGTMDSTRLWKYKMGTNCGANCGEMCMNDCAGSEVVSSFNV